MSWQKRTPAIAAIAAVVIACLWILSGKGIFTSAVFLPVAWGALGIYAITLLLAVWFGTGKLAAPIMVCSVILSSCYIVNFLGLPAVDFRDSSSVVNNNWLYQASVPVAIISWFSIVSLLIINKVLFRSIKTRTKSSR